MNLFKTVTLALLSGSLINCTTTSSVNQDRSLASDRNSWMSCYEFDEDNSVNNLFFYDPAQVNSVREEGESNCRHSSIRYVGPQNFEMMDGDAQAIEEQIKQANNLQEELDAFFSGSQAASTKAITLSNGTRLHAARWSNGIGPSLTIILKPNLENGTVQEVCRFRNKTQKVEVRELTSRNELIVFYRSDSNRADYSNRTDEYDHFIGWKKCASLSNL